jgi:hypothetical protein
MKQSASRQLYSHWNEIRRGRVSPERADLDPAAIRGCIADTFMLEIDTGRSYPFRLCGTRLGALFTKDPKGESFLEFWGDACARDMADLLASVHDEAAIIVAGVEAGAGADRRAAYELLLLPLRCKGKTHERVVGCLAPVAIPAWLGLVEGHPLGLSSWRSVSQAALRLGGDPMGQQKPSALQRVGGAFDVEQDAARRRAHLTVHQGGRESPVKNF